MKQHTYNIQKQFSLGQWVHAGGPYKSAATAIEAARLLSEQTGSLHRAEHVIVASASSSNRVRGHPGRHLSPTIVPSDPRVVLLKGSKRRGEVKNP